MTIDISILTNMILINLPVRLTGAGRHKPPNKDGFAEIFFSCFRMLKNKEGEVKCKSVREAKGAGRKAQGNSRYHFTII